MKEGQMILAFVPLAERSYIFFPHHNSLESVATTLIIKLRSQKEGLDNDNNTKNKDKSWFSPDEVSVVGGRSSFKPVVDLKQKAAHVEVNVYFVRHKQQSVFFLTDNNNEYKKSEINR